MISGISFPATVTAKSDPDNNGIVRVTVVSAAGATAQFSMPSSNADLIVTGQAIDVHAEAFGVQES